MLDGPGMSISWFEGPAERVSPSFSRGPGNESTDAAVASMVGSDGPATSGFAEVTLRGGIVKVDG
jgi:hypothetical protein